MHLSIHPVGAGESISSPVSEVLNLIRASGLDHEVGAMGTTVEGDWDACIAILNTCREQLSDCERLRIDVSFDVRMDGGRDALNHKAESVTEEL